MQFEFEGKTFRIAFRHPVPTDLSYHKDHEVSLDRLNGRVRLFCDECEVRFGRRVQLALRRKDEVRNVDCVIYIGASAENAKPLWQVITSGASQLNRKAKDQYTREGGRRAALNNALSQMFNAEYLAALSFTAAHKLAEFRAAAVAAYENRKNLAGEGAAR